MRQLNKLFSLIIVIALVSSTANAESFKLKQITEGLEIPWGMTAVSENLLLVTERQGTAKLVDLKTGDHQVIKGLPKVVSRGQGGLLDVALSPNFDQTQEIYFSYAKPIENKQTLALGKAKLVGTELKNWQDIFISNYVSKSVHHFGSRITFDQNNKLYLSHGDRGDRHQAQNLSNHAGTILRLDLDGSVPKDNPFVGDKNAAPEIWSYGHRNPQGLTFDKETGQLWSNEHGPRGGDEINLIKKGNNYGWPVISYGREYISRRPVGEDTAKAGMEQPIKYYVPSIAPSGLIVYRGSLFPEWDGDFFSGALALQHLNQVKLTKDGTKETRHLEEMKQRVRNVYQLPTGEILIGNDHGKIFALTPKATKP